MKKFLFFLAILLLFNVADASLKREAVRAVWVPDPSHTRALTTYGNILKTVDLMSELRLNTIFLCAWAKGKTIYPSPFLKSRSSWATPDDGYLLKEFLHGYNHPVKSPTGDPLQDLIREAHKRKIKVILWFEYGFMASHGPTPGSDPLLTANPHWMSRGNDGEQSNYNKTDYYFNAYHPDVQQFMLKLMEEAITLYPGIDGIQGDDRMPAMPRNSGYDEYTVARFRSEHNGAEPPADFNQPDWVRWRLNNLNNFAKEMHRIVKAKNPGAMVCFSPNPYPWCMDNLMQEWPEWIGMGIVDLLSVQCYRNTIEAYTSTVETTKKYVREKTGKNILNPGIILKNGNKIMVKELLIQQLEVNKQLNTNGEAYFYNEGLFHEQVQKVLKTYYIRQKQNK